MTSFTFGDSNLNLHLPYRSKITPLITILGDHLETTNIGSPLFANQLSLMDRWMHFLGGQMFGSSLSHTPHDTSVQKRYVWCVRRYEQILRSRIQSLYLPIPGRGKQWIMKPTSVPATQALLRQGKKTYVGTFNCLTKTYTFQQSNIAGWNIHHLKANFLVEKVAFHCYVRLPACNRKQIQ